MSRVLVVDDESAGVEIRKLVLEREGHQVTLAANVTEALQGFHAAAPHVVIMDLRLPLPEDGFSLIRQFRALSPGVRIVVLSGCGTDLDRREETSMVDEILIKPVRSERLLNAVMKRAPQEGPAMIKK